MRDVSQGGVSLRAVSLRAVSRRFAPGWIGLFLCLSLALIARGARAEAVSVVAGRVSGAQGVARVSFVATLPEKGPGFGLVLAPVGKAVAISDPVEPTASGVFGIGFDTQNPPPEGGQREKWFNPAGNFYGRPEREVSLHTGGREIDNRRSEPKLVGAHSYAVEIESVVGGALVSVFVDSAPIYERRFVAELSPVAGEFRLLAESGAATFSRATVLASGRAPAPKPAIRVRAVDAARNDAKNHRISRDVLFPKVTDGVGRVVATLTLDATPEGIDPWDRLAQVFLIDERGERFELIRYITPYKKAWQWKVDVTDYLPLLTGKKTILVECETYSEGWLVSVDFDFYPGPIERVPYRVVNLWNGRGEIGLADRPIGAFLTPKRVDFEARTVGASLRTIVTGHGMSPNSDNAGEFHPLWRRVYADGLCFANLLWKTDVYLNPCRPQGGTWKFDRAGWSPGDVVAPWIVDLDSLATGQNRAVELRYELENYVNKTPNKDFLANQVFGSQLILYRASGTKPVAR